MKQTTTRDKNTFFQPINAFALHIIAMLLMLCDHLWGTFAMHIDALANLGRIAFPIFVFMLVEGFALTKSRKKYALRLLVFALISEVPFNLMMGRRVFYPLHQNVLFAFLICIALMCVYERIKTRKNVVLRIVLYTAATILFYALGFITFVDYYGYGVLITALFYFTRSAKDTKAIGKILRAIIQCAVLFYICSEMIQGIVIPVNIFGLHFEMHRQTFALIALPLIWLYNGRQGPYNKGIRFLYYSFYPAHLLILGIMITLV